MKSETRLAVLNAIQTGAREHQDSDPNQNLKPELQQRICRDIKVSGQILPGISPETLEGFCIDDEAKQIVKKSQEQFRLAETVILLCGTSGLGDAMSQVRAARVFQEQGKKVICQMPETLIPLFKETDGISFQHLVSAELLQDPKCFFISLDPYKNPANFPEVPNWAQIDWPANTPHEKVVHQPDGTFASFFDVSQNVAFAADKLRDDGRFYDHVATFGNASMYSVWQKLGVSATSTIHFHNSYYALRLFPLIEKAIDLNEYNVGLIDIGEISKIQQDLDLLLILDAKEAEIPGGERSLKSPPIEAIAGGLKELIRTKKLRKIGVVIGTTHPEYCVKLKEALSEISEECVIEHIQGDIKGTIIPAMLRSKNILFSDSVPGYIAVQVAETAEEQGRAINLLSTYNEQVFKIQDYGHPGVPTLAYDNQVFANYNVVLGELHSYYQGVVLPHLTEPTEQDVQEFLEKHLHTKNHEVGLSDAS